MNVEHVKAAVEKLREINWLYADVEESSVDEASRRVIECVSDTTSQMLVKASAEDVKSFQAYTIRLLDQKQSSLTDSEHFKLINVIAVSLKQNNLPHSRGRQQPRAASAGHKVPAPQVQWILPAKEKG